MADTELLKIRLEEYVSHITKKDRDGAHWHCPLCGSGAKGTPDSDGAFSLFGENHELWHCFSCGKSGDIFTLIGEIEGLQTFHEQIAFAKQFFGDITPPPVQKQRSQPQKHTQHDFKAYLSACADAVGQTDYWTSVRGFSDATVKRFHLGFDAAKRAVTIPYDEAGSYFITRSVSEKQFRKPKADAAGEEPIFHRAALYGTKPVFLCESPIDAISVMAAGDFQAVSLGGTGYRKLLSLLDKKPFSAPLILCFDCDTAGETASANLARELIAKGGVAFTTAQFSLDAYPESFRKDCNDFLRGNAAQFAADLQSNVDAVLTLDIAARSETDAELSAHSAAGRLPAFLTEIHTPQNEAVKTGFANLDEVLDGGLYAGLMILGAISSLGKTSLLVQLADQIAAQGTDVLYFSLEMSASELMAKSISRLTYQISGKNTSSAKTARDLMVASRYRNYTASESELIDKAVNEYRTLAPNLYFYEGVGDIGAWEIREITEKHIKLTGRRPVVCVDYLQILAPYEIRATDKQNVDKAVLELKRMSRDFSIPVVAISSLNRASYAGETTMASFKESGAIEYGSDLLFALQPQGIGESADAVKAVNRCKTLAERLVELVVLKNRSGRTGAKVGMVYQAKYNCFSADIEYCRRNLAIAAEDDDEVFMPAME